MRRKYRANCELHHRLLDFLGADAEFAQLAHRPPRRRRLRIRDALAEVRIATPDAVRLLGGVDKEKEERKGSRGHCAVLGAETIDLSQQIVQTRGIRISASARAGRDAQLFDDLERFLSLEPPDHPPESAGQPADVLVEWNVFFSWGSRGGHDVKYRVGPLWLRIAD